MSGSGTVMEGGSQRISCTSEPTRRAHLAPASTKPAVNFVCWAFPVSPGAFGPLIHLSTKTPRRQRGEVHDASLVGLCDL